MLGTALCLHWLSPVLLLAAGAGAVGISVPSAGLVANPCTDSWTGPSTGNDLSSCDADTVVEWLVGRLALVLSPVVVGLLACVVGFPASCCARYVCDCCGSSKLRPGEGCCGGSHWDYEDEATKLKKYTVCEVRCNKWVTFALLLCTGAACVLAFAGATLLLSAINDTVSGGFDVGDWIFSLVDRFTAALRDSAGNLPSDFAATVSQIKDVRKTVDDAERDVLDSDAMNYLKAGVALMGYPAIAPALVTVGGVVAAVCLIRTCLPACLVYLAFNFAFLFGLFASILFTLEMPFGVVCHEFDAQLAREPGFFQWGLVPQCSDTNPIRQLDDTVRSNEATVAADGCGKIRDVCTEAAVYDPSSPAVIFRCTDRSRTCSTVANVTAFMADLTILSPGLCTVPGCNITQCAANCTDATARSTSADAVKLHDEAVRLVTAFRDIFGPWLECDVFFDRLVRAMPLCDVSSGLLLLGSACALTVVTMIAAVPVLFMGQKRFFDKDLYTEGTEAFGGGSYQSMNAGATAVSGGGAMLTVPAVPQQEPAVVMGAPMAAYGCGDGVAPMAAFDPPPEEMGAVKTAATTAPDDDL